MLRRRNLMPLRLTFLLPVCLVASVSPAAPAVQVTVSPARPYVESTRAGQALNFDLLVRNDGASAIKLVAIRERVFDRAGRLQIEREVNANGSPPALAALGDALLSPGGTADLFQPFVDLDREVDVARVQLELLFLSVDTPTPPIAREGDVVTIDVEPFHMRPPAYLVPICGLVLVHDGHDLSSHHRRRRTPVPASDREPAAVNPNLFAYDLVRVDSQGVLVHGNPDQKENWLTFGAEVRSPVDGVVDTARDGVVDNEFRGGLAKVPPEAEAADPQGFGNVVSIRAADGRVSWLLHLERGSLRVLTGQRVHSGDVVGNVGFSGDSLFPHLHYMVTAGGGYPSPGMPSMFRRFDRILGSRSLPIRYGPLETGDLVSCHR